MAALGCVMEDVDSDDSFPILWVSGLDQLIVLMLTVAYSIETFQHKLEQSLKFSGDGEVTNILAVPAYPVPRHAGYSTLDTLCVHGHIFTREHRQYWSQVLWEGYSTMLT